MSREAGNGGAVVMLVEDEPAIAETLVYALRTEGLTPVWCATAGAATEHRNRHGDPDCILLDVGLPDAHGFDWFRQLRRESEVPVLFITARDELMDRVAGLELGADDYVTKPFHPREVMARVRAVLRRAGGGGSRSGVDGLAMRAVAHAEAFAVAEDQAQVGYHGERLCLTRQELSLLQVLLSRPGRIWSREELLMRGWPEPEASADRTVDAHIKLLRAKLRRIRPDADPILTHRGIGYSLRAD